MFDQTASITCVVKYEEIIVSEDNPAHAEKLYSVDGSEVIMGIRNGK